MQQCYFFISARHVFRCEAYRSDSRSPCSSNRECPCGEHCKLEAGAGPRRTGWCATAECDELDGLCSAYGWVFEGYSNNCISSKSSTKSTCSYTYLKPTAQA